MKYLLRRFFSYIIDMILISLIMSLISCIPFFYRCIESYQKYNNEYSDDLSYDLDFITKYYKKDFDALKVHDSSLSKYVSDDNFFLDEYDDTMDKILAEVSDKSKKFGYHSLKLQMPISVLSIIISLLYFSFVPLFLCGKTLGMKIMKMEFVSDNLSFNNYFIRGVFLTSSISFLISSIALYNMDYLKFYVVYLIICMIKFIYGLFNFIMIIGARNHRGLTDLIAGTEIVGR